MASAVRTERRSRTGAGDRCLAAALLVLCLGGSALPCVAQEDVAPRPPMGWSSWNKFGIAIDDQTIRAQADAMVASGMRDAGYRYINIDDGWQGTRDTQGNLRPNVHFPDMKALADYVHARGLKLGIYTSPNRVSCAQFIGSLGHELQDTRTFAGWGIDFVKYDLCGYNHYARTLVASDEAAENIVIEAYRSMAAAIKASGRPMVFSMSQYGHNLGWRWATSAGANLWRTTGDIADNYERMAWIGFGQAGLSRYAGPGHWNDPDMLEVGNGGMTVEEYRTHVTLWAMLAAPLIAGNDLTRMTPDTIGLLTQPEVIAIDQDSAGIQGDRLSAEGGFEVWTRPLSDGSKAVAFFNRQGPWLKGEWMSLDLKGLGLGDGVRVRDLWKREDIVVEGSLLKRWVPAHGAMLFRVSRK